MLKRVLFIVFLVLLISAPAFAQSSQSFSLKEGYNFISFTVNPSVTPLQLKSSTSAISDIYSYNAAAGSFLSAAAGELTSLGAGKGYIIKTTGAATASAAGTTLSSVNVITLKAGFNLTGFSKVPETLTFSQLMQRSQSIKGLYKWNAAAGSFLAVVRNGSSVEQLDGADPTFKAGESYFFNMYEETTLDYNGSTIAVGGSTANRVASPTFNPPAGTYTSAQTVTIYCSTSGASIRYTTDGSAPTSASALYISPITVSQSMTISAIGIKAGMDNSYASTATYTFGASQAPAITSVTGTSVDNGNDTVKVVFNTAMNKTSVEMASNWQVKYDDDKSAGGETPLSLTATSLFYDSNNLTLTITLKKVENSAYLPNGKYVVVAPTTSVKNSAGTSITATPVYSTSVVSGDITAPNPPAEADKSKLGFSNAANKVSIVSGPLTTNREATILEVYTGASQPSAATAPTKRSAIKTAAGHITGDAITGIAAATAGHGVWYRYSDGAGNKSAWLADGTIPADPVVTALSLNNTTGALIVGGTAVTSSTAFDSIQVYYDDNGSGAGLTLLNYTAFAMINGTNTTYNATAKGAWTAVPTGKLTSYAIQNSDDNISGRKYDSSNPPAVVIPERIYMSTHDKKIGFMANINGGANTGLVLYVKVTRNGSETVYKYNSAFANNLDGSFTFAVGTATNQFTQVSGDVITATFPRAGDEMSYALEAASKVSTYRPDGNIPAVPDATKLAYNAATGYVTVTAGATTNTSTSSKLTCYQSNDAQGSVISEKGVKTSADLSGAYTFQASTGGVIAADAYVIYTLTNEYGNISAYSVDGTVPAAPALPAATTLIAANDGGSYALPGFVNDSGSKAVKMRPGIALVTGEALSLKAVAGATVTMTAKATLSATPVFGEQTANVVYTGGAATDGDPITGSFNFTTINSGAVSVGASKVNVNGNASVFSAPVVIQYQADSTPPRLALITDIADPNKDKPDCYAVDTENDGKLNALVLKFNKNIKINGSLNTAAGAGYFHNGVTVYNGTSDTPLTVTGYSTPSTDRLAIAFDNSVAGTGIVKINIVNADSLNFLSDLYGNKFAAINLNASSTAVSIPDKVAPPSSKIIPANLSFNNQNGYVILSSASLPCGESARLEIFLGANPLPATAATASALNFVTQHDTSATTPLLTFGAGGNANDGVYYRLADSAGNKSAWVADGSIPASPDLAKLGYSAESGNVTVLTGVTTNSNSASILRCYQSSDNVGTVLSEKGSKTGVDLSTYNTTFTASANGVIQTGAYVLYTLTNENGNISKYAIDGVIPAIPVLPAADSLVAAGDGGLNAKAGYVNSAGQTTVTMRPAIALLNGEGLTIKAVKTNTIKMTARVSADLTPVFGTQNASVIFAPGVTGDGSATTGSLNFTTLSTGEVAVYASKINTSGNASLWSEAKGVFFDTSVSAPQIVIASCYAVDDEKDGNINSLVLKFNKPVKINGTLDNGAAAGNFHNGITVYDGIMDQALTVTGYAVQNNDELKITLNNAVSATGRVKVNIVNAHATNFLSDLYGNKLAAVNLNASSSAVTIPDLVAPSSAKIVAGNLSFSNASGKVALSGAAITCGESAKLEVYFGTNPSDATTAAASKASAATHELGELITGIPAKSAGNYIFFRLVDDSDNKSTWVLDGSIPASPTAANLTWSDAGSTVTIANAAVSDASNLLRIYRKNSTAYTYLGRVVDGSNAPLNGPYTLGSTYNAKTDANAVIKVYNSASDYVAYTLYNTSGHESAYANATNAPPDAPQVSKLYVNAQNKTINYSASLNNSSNNTLRLYIKLTRGLNVATYKATAAFNTDANGTLTFPGDFTLVGTATLADFPVTGDAIEYALENASGQISSYTADGTIPTAPTAANKFIYNASLNTVTYQAALNGSANTSYRLFVEATKGAVTDRVEFFSNALLAAGPASVSLGDFSRSAVTGVETNVYDATPAIIAGITVKYGVIDANGNVSALTSSITVPAAPLANKLSYNAASGRVSSEAGVTTDASTSMVLNCYQADSQTGSGISSSKGSVTAVNFSANNASFVATTGGVIAANKYILYTLTDATGNVSAYTADGLLPAAPDAAKLYYSANETANHVTVFSDMTTNTNIASVLTCYQSNDAAGTTVTEKGSKTGIDLTGAFTFTADSNGGAITTGKYVLYTLTNENKNVSAYAADGTIPAAPTLPAATSLVAANDGGAFAAPGFVNSAGKLAVKMRPAIAIAANEAVTVKVSDKAGAPNVIRMSAASLSAVTPVFGEQTAGVTYSGTGNSTTGSLDFTTMTTAGLTVAGAVTNSNGNSSNWSTPAVDISYDSGNTAPAITIADCYATDDDGDGKLNTLVLKFNEKIKINGTLSNTAAATAFHNGLTVNNGTGDTPLNVTGYSVTGDNSDMLTVTFDNSVTGTGLVKMNIVNAHASNFLSDEFGLKLAAINLNASDVAHTIPDKVAPSKTKIVVANLFYNNAVKTVTLASADISCGETAKFEVFFGSDPTDVTVATASKASAASHVMGTLISGIASQNSVGVYYRLVDDSNNKSAWVADGSVPAPPTSANITWSDDTSKFTIANLTIGDTTTILRIYRRDEIPATPTYTYLGRAVTDGTNTDKKGIYAIGVHSACQDGGWAIKVYNDPKHFVAYTLYNDSGNESTYADDANAAPTAPTAANLFVNAQDKTINYSSGLNGSDNTNLRLCLKVKRGASEAIYKSKNLFSNNNSGTLTFITDFTRISTTSLDDFPLVGDAVEYALETATGKISSYTADGTIPAGAVSSTKFSYNASTNLVNYQGSINGSTNANYKLFVEAVKNADKVVFFSTAVLVEGTATKNLNSDFTRIATPAGNETNVYGTAPALVSGVSLKYSLIDKDSGNISPAIAVGTVPAAPDAAKLAYSLSAKTVTTLAGVSANTSTSSILTCYQSDNASGTAGLVSRGTKTGINFNTTGTSFAITDITADKYALYTLTDENGNVSAYTADGTIPQAPTASKLAYSAITGDVSVTLGVTSNTSTLCVIRCYQADSAAGANITPEKGSKTGVDFSANNATFTATGNGGIIAEGKYVIYTLTNENGNTSAYTADGTIPQAPGSAALHDLAVRQSTAGKYKVKRVDVTTASDLTALMDILFTLDNGTVLTKCGQTDGVCAYSEVADIGDVSTLVISSTPKYAYKNSDGNTSALSAADGAFQSLSAASLEPMGGVITFSYSAAVTGLPAQEDFDVSKSGVISLAANALGTAAGSVAEFGNNWTITGDDNTTSRTFTIKTTAQRAQSVTGQLMAFGDGTAGGGKLFNLNTNGTKNIYETAGGNMLIPAAADRKITFNVTSDLTPVLSGVKGETSAGVFTLLANGNSIINAGNFQLEFNKPMIANMTTLSNSTTTSWASGTPPVFNAAGATPLAGVLTTMVLDNTANPGQITTNDYVNVTKTAVLDLMGKSAASDYRYTVVSDVTKPIYSSISVQSAAYNTNVVKLTFSKSVWWSTPLTDTTHVVAKVDGVARTVTTIDARLKGAAAATLNITVGGAAITDGQAVSVQITGSGAAYIKDNTANENVLDTGVLTRSVNYAADTTPPTFDSVTVQNVKMDENVIKLTFSEPVWWGDGLSSGDITASVAGETRMLDKIDGGVPPNTRLKGSAITTMTITVKGNAITNGQAVFVSVTLTGAAKIKDNSYSENVMQGAQNKTVTAAVSTAPTPAHFFANALTQTISITGSTPNAIAKVYVGGTFIQSTTLGSSGNGSITGISLAANNSMSYSLTESGKIESLVVSDGIIPYATIDGGAAGTGLATCMQASGVTDKVKTSTSMAGTGCYLLVNNASNTAYVASANLVANSWVSPVSQRGGVTALPLNTGAVSYQFENADGNASPKADDGSILGAPDSAYVHIESNGKITWTPTSGSSDKIYSLYYTYNSTPPISELNETGNKMLQVSATAAMTAVMPAMNSTVVGDTIQWVVYDSASGNYSEGSNAETFVGVSNQASAYTNQTKKVDGGSANIFVTTGLNLDYMKVLFTGPIVVTTNGDNLSKLTTTTDLSGIVAGGTLTNSAITAIAGKTTTKSSVVLKISNLGGATCTLTLSPGTTKFNLTAATTKITDAYGNAVFPAAAGPIITGTTAQNETDD